MKNYNYDELSEMSIEELKKIQEKIETVMSFEDFHKYKIINEIVSDLAIMSYTGYLEEIKKPPIIMSPVISSNIENIGYRDPELYIEFTGGGIYKYKKVPENIFNELKEAKSIGRYLAKNIKNKYEFEKIKEEI